MGLVLTMCGCAEQYSSSSPACDPSLPTTTGILRVAQFIARRKPFVADINVLVGVIAVADFLAPMQAIEFVQTVPT